MISVRESKFLSSASSLKNAPAPVASEIVFLGRSNVGKSTLINALLNKNLAKSSSTPGKTQLINFFYSLWVQDGTNIPFIFVDLPGFGYAKVSKSIKKEWEKMLFEFLLSRRSIKLFLQLVDSRHSELEIDSGVQQLLLNIAQGDQRILRIYTKADKLKQSELNILSQKLKENEYIVSTTTNHRKLMPISVLREEICRQTLGESLGE